MSQMTTLIVAFVALAIVRVLLRTVLEHALHSAAQRYPVVQTILQLVGFALLVGLAGALAWTFPWLLIVVLPAAFAFGYFRLNPARVSPHHRKQLPYLNTMFPLPATNPDDLANLPGFRGPLRTESPHAAASAHGFPTARGDSDSQTTSQRTPMSVAARMTRATLVLAATSLIAVIVLFFIGVLKSRGFVWQYSLIPELVVVATIVGAMLVPSPHSRRVRAMASISLVGFLLMVVQWQGSAYFKVWGLLAVATQLAGAIAVITVMTKSADPDRV